MDFLRSSIFNLFLFSWTTTIGVLFFPTAFLGTKMAVPIARFWAYGTILMLQAMCGIKLEVRGKENIKEGAAIIAAKHQSALETIALYLALKSPVYILKRELVYLPVIGLFIKAVDSIMINRNGGAATLKDMLRQVEERIKQGRQVIIFPEGTRVKAGEKGVYQSGIAAIYSKTNMDVIPVALNTGKCWPKNSFTKKSGKAVIEFLEPIKAGLSKKDFMSALEEKIETASQKLFKED